MLCISAAYAVVQCLSVGPSVRLSVRLLVRHVITVTKMCNVMLCYVMCLTKMVAIQISCDTKEYSILPQN